MAMTRCSVPGAIGRSTPARANARPARSANAAFPGCAMAENPTIVALKPPAGVNMMSFVSQVENLSVEPDSPAKVVIDEVAGVIVMGENVRVSTVAIQQGNLTITVKESSAVSQPLPAFAQTAVQLVPGRAGEFGFACGMNMVHGTLVIEATSLDEGAPAAIDRGPETASPAKVPSSSTATPTPCACGRATSGTRRSSTCSRTSTTSPSRTAPPR